MKTQLLIILFFSGNLFFAQQKISGKVMSENDMVISSVLVVNISNDKKTYSDGTGNFTVEGSSNDELRFVKIGYERVSKIIVNPEKYLDVTLIRIPEEIEGVSIINVSGDLKSDSRRLSKVDTRIELQNSIGLPKTPAVQRESVPTWKTVFARGIPNIFQLYKMISGDARRKRSLYKFEDSSKHMDWVISSTDDEYFAELNIPKENIREFLGFAFQQYPICLDRIKDENINGALFEIEKAAPEFVQRLKNRNK